MVPDSQNGGIFTISHWLSLYRGREEEQQSSVVAFLGAEGILTALVRTTVAFREDFFVGLDGLALPDNPRRWTLPITAFLVTSPSSLAIWLADKPSAHSLLSISTRSSVHAILKYSPYRYLDKAFQ
jgi:hypothetical protein